MRSNVENSSAKLAQLMIIPVAATRRLTGADYITGVIPIAASRSPMNAVHQQTSLRYQDLVLAGWKMVRISSCLKAKIAFLGLVNQVEAHTEF
jgi:hypothetical protein